MHCPAEAMMMRVCLQGSVLDKKPSKGDAEGGLSVKQDEQAAHAHWHNFMASIVTKLTVCDQS